MCPVQKMFVLNETKRNTTGKNRFSQFTLKDLLLCCGHRANERRQSYARGTERSIGNRGRLGRGSIYTEFCVGSEFRGPGFSMLLFVSVSEEMSSVTSGSDARVGLQVAT